MRRSGRLDRVADRNGAARRPLVGRAGELDAVVGLVQRSVSGDGGALLISGEAGVGKTALVREARDRVESNTDVLWAPCLPLSSLAVPFLPLMTALRGWAAGRDVPAPSFGESNSAGTLYAPVEFSAWLDQQSGQRPVLLVVDDLQWADQSTLDVLMYALAALSGRRVAMVATVRAGEEGEPLRRWLADVRRFPGVAELTLGRLDRVATGEQLAALLGSMPHQSLIDDVYTRSKGNAYLNSLLGATCHRTRGHYPPGYPVNCKTLQPKRGVGCRHRRGS
jgi:hypothetical protein